MDFLKVNFHSLSVSLFFCWQVEWSSSSWLQQGRRDQNYLADYLSWGSYSEAWKLWKRLSFCFFCFQTTGFQVAKTDGLQGETGKEMLNIFYKIETNVLNPNNVSIRLFCVYVVPYLPVGGVNLPFGFEVHSSFWIKMFSHHRFVWVGRTGPWNKGLMTHSWQMCRHIKNTWSMFRCD